MLPDDPRHGSEAGTEQHNRDGEAPCLACYDAKLRASRRRTKLKTMGYRFRVPVGNRLYDYLIRLQDRGASHKMIGRWSGLSQPLISRIFREGPAAIISSRTAAALWEMKVDLPVTPIGATRRIQALACLGYSADRVARETGLHEETVKVLRVRPGAHINTATGKKIADAYDRLSMQIPTGGNKQERGGVTRARGIARRRGWAPPLAWNDIDNDLRPATPKGDGHREDRIDHAVVRRILDSGQRTRQLTRAEASEVVGVLLARGLSTYQIEHDYGLKPERYKSNEEAVA